MVRQLIFTLLFATCLLTGCVPRQFYDRPGVSGQLVDAVSGVPIRDVTIVVEGPVNSQSLPATTARSR